MANLFLANICKHCISDDQLWDEDTKEEELMLEGGEEEEENSGMRKARFLVYWMTTTR